MSVNVVVRQGREAGNARGATCADTDSHRSGSLPVVPAMPSGEPASEGRTISGSIAASEESMSTSTSTPTSSSSEEPSRDSKRRWQKPMNVRQFAAQANEVATMILNGEIDLDIAQKYASLARVVAASVSVEVTRSRFLKQEPDLSLGDGE